MSARSAYQIKFSDLALELMMRDVMGGLEEFSTMVGFEANPYAFEILAITPPERWDHENNRSYPPDQCGCGDNSCSRCGRFKRSASIHRLRDFQQR